MKINILVIFFLLTIVFENNQTQSKFKKKYKKNIFNKNKSLKKRKKIKTKNKNKTFSLTPVLNTQEMNQYYLSSLKNDIHSITKEIFELKKFDTTNEKEFLESLQELSANTLLTTPSPNRLIDFLLNTNEEKDQIIKNKLIQLQNNIKKYNDTFINIKQEENKLKLSNFKNEIEVLIRELMELAEFDEEENKEAQMLIQNINENQLALFSKINNIIDNFSIKPNNEDEDEDEDEIIKNKLIQLQNNIKKYNQALDTIKQEENELEFLNLKNEIHTLTTELVQSNKIDPITEKKTLKLIKNITKNELINVIAINDIINSFVEHSDEINNQIIKNKIFLLKDTIKKYNHIVQKAKQQESTIEKKLISQKNEKISENIINNNLISKKNNTKKEENLMPESEHNEKIIKNKKNNDIPTNGNNNYTKLLNLKNNIEKITNELIESKELDEEAKKKAQQLSKDIIQMNKKITFPKIKNTISNLSIDANENTQMIKDKLIELQNNIEQYNQTIAKIKKEIENKKTHNENISKEMNNSNKKEI